MKKPGRNEPCHCGSGKKYKKCCEQKDEIAAIAAVKTETLGKYPFDDFDDLSPADELMLNELRLQQRLKLNVSGELGTGYGDDSFAEGRSSKAWENDENSSGNNVLKIKVDDADDQDDLYDEDDADFEDDVKDEDNIRDVDFDVEEDTEIDSSYPSISEADQTLVDQWWDSYREMDDLDAIRSHLDDFILKRPDLVENLGLEHEVIFELGGQYLSEDRTDEYIAFLMDFRQRFPSAYIRSAGWYDKDIIAWLIKEHRRDEIGNYTNHFIAHPVSFYKPFADLLELMLAADVTDELLVLLHAVAKPLLESRKIFGAEYLVQSLVADLFARNLKVNNSKDDVLQFVREANATLPIELDDEEPAIDEWLQLMHDTTRPFTAWPSKLPTRANEREALVKKMGFNFAYFMLKQVGISWVSARHYGLTLTLFLVDYWKVASNKNSTYIFQPQRIDNIASSISSTGLFEGPVLHIAILNALYYFADYLETCGNLERIQREKVQDICARLADNLLDEEIDQDLAIACFEQFPLFGTLNK